MKVRSGFVSNSSSSSFIVAFNKKPTCKYDVCFYLFPPVNGIHDKIIDPYGTDPVDAGTASKLVWDQIKDQKPLTKTQILEEIQSGWFEGYPDLTYSDDPSWQISKEYYTLTKKNIWDKDADPEWKKKYDIAWKKHHQDYIKTIENAAKELMEREYPKKFKGKKAYVITFSDNDGKVFATLEHGNTFDNVPHLKISHH